MITIQSPNCSPFTYHFTLISFPIGFLPYLYEPIPSMRSPLSPSHTISTGPVHITSTRVFSPFSTVANILVFSMGGNECENPALVIVIDNRTFSSPTASALMIISLPPGSGWRGQNIPKKIQVPSDNPITKTISRVFFIGSSYISEISPFSGLYLIIISYQFFLNFTKNIYPNPLQYLEEVSWSAPSKKPVEPSCGRS